jgi:hypothetical protein
VVDLRLGGGAVSGIRRMASGGLGRVGSALSGLLVFATVALHLLNGGPADPESVVLVLVMVSFISVGAILVARRPDSPTAWLMAATGFFVTVSAFAYEYLTYTVVTNPGSLPGPHLAALGGFGFFAWVTIAACYLPLVFPTGRPPTRGWRWVAWAGTAGLALVIVTTIPLVLALPVAELTSGEPLRAESQLVQVLSVLGPALLVVAIGGALVSMFVRFRRSTGVERSQLKWFLYAAGITVIGVTAEFIDQGLFSLLALGTGFVAIPVAVAIAILRYRLYDIDLVINRTLVYGALTALLGLVYVGLVVALSELLRPVAGANDLAVAGSTLVVAALFTPARRRIQTLVDRRFYRSRYDAARTVEAFSTRLRDRVDLEELSADLVRVVRETLQPASASVWLREARR